MKFDENLQLSANQRKIKLTRDKKMPKRTKPTISHTAVAAQTKLLGDLYGAGVKAPTEPAGEKDPQVFFSFAGVFFFQTKRKCQGTDLMSGDMRSVKEYL